MAARKKFSQLPKAARDRAARIGKEEYGLSRRQVRERYNRGTYNPYARKDPMLRIPGEFRRHVIEEPGGQIVVDWRTLAYNNMRNMFGPGNDIGERHKWNDDVVYNTAHYVMSDRAAQLVALATKSELEAWAGVQPFLNGPPADGSDAFPGLPADITMDDIGYYRDGDWYNIFWYH